MTKATEFLAAAGWTSEQWDYLNGTYVHRSVDYYIKAIEIRDKYIGQFGFAILDGKTVESLQPFHPIVEVGAGSGYWSYELTQAGMESIATDPGTGKYAHSCFGSNSRWEKPWVPIEQITGREAVCKYPNHTLLMVWPDLLHGNDDWPLVTIAAYTGKHVLYVGEGDGGCTGTDRFHKYLEANFEQIDTIDIPQFWGVHDHLQIWKRNPHRRIKL